MRTRLRSTASLPCLALLLLGGCSDSDSPPPAASPAAAAPSRPAPAPDAKPAKKGKAKEPGSGAAAAPDSAQAIFESGVDWSRKGDNLKAVEEYRRALAIDPNHVGAHFALGTTLVPQSYVVVGSGVRDFKILDEAIEHLQRADELEESAEHAYWLGRALALHNQNDEAIAALTRAVGMDPSHGLAHKRLGLIYNEKGATEQALAEFQKALETLPKDPGVLFQIGNLEQADDPVAARAAYEKAIAIDPTFPYAYHGLATVLARLGDEEGAKKARDQGALCKQLEDKLQARVKKASESPADVEAQVAAGEMFFALKRWEDGLQMFRRALALDQTDPNVHMYCGIILRELGETETARNHLEESCYLWQQQGQEQVQPVIELARVYDALDNQSRVKELVDKASGLLEKSEDLVDHLIAADGFLALGRKEEAAKEYGVVLAGDPENAKAQQGLALARGPETPK